MEINLNMMVDILFPTFRNIIILIYLPGDIVSEGLRQKEKNCTEF